MSEKVVSSFVEAVRLFENHKKASGKQDGITRDELKKLREAFKQGKIKVTDKETKSYAKLLEEFKVFKKARTGSNEVSLKERVMLRKNFDKLDESTTSDFRQLLIEYTQFKKSKGQDPKVSLAERRVLKESIDKKLIEADKPAYNPAVYNKLLEEFSAYKKSQTGDGKVSLSERRELKEALIANSKPAAKLSEETNKVIKSKLNEARFKIFATRKALKEGDIPAAQGAVGGAQDAMGAVDAAANGTQLPPDITQKIQALQATIGELATAAGIEPAVDLGANAAAGVPGDTSAGVDPSVGPNPDPNAAPMMEQTFDIEAAKRRIAEREKKLSEHVGAGKVARQTVDDIKDLGADHSFAGAQLSGGRRIATANPPSQGQGEGSTAEAIKGSKTAANTWPTSPAKGIQQKGGATSQSKNINESVEPPQQTPPVEGEAAKEDAKKVNESKEIPLDEIHLNKILNEEKLDWKKLWSTGILG